MKHLLGYVIWNKAEQIEWLIDGILESFDPKQVDLAFVFDNPTDGSFGKFTELLPKLSAYNVVFVKVTGVDTYKFPCQNYLLEFAIEKRKYKTLICPQDDQKITDPYMIHNIENILDRDRHVGVIGLRDGFEFGYGNMVSSSWSESEYDQPRLNNGAWNQVKLINDGPIVYPISTIKKVGTHDVESYNRFYIEDDYCMKCNEAGLRNYVMGNSLIHDRSKSSVASDHYSSNFGEQDLIKFRNKWNV